MDGTGMEEGWDWGEANKWFQKAAAQGHIDANVWTYDLQLSFGGLKEENAKEAVKWFKKAVEQDSVYVNMACGGLGKCYMQGLGVEQDFKKAALYLKRAVVDEEPDADILYYLGWCYYYGEGIAQDYAEAVRCLQLAYNQEYMGAEILLGMCYQFGQGVNKDSEKAVEMYRKGVKRYDGEALYLLGCCYAAGDGVKRNYEEAARLIQEAIDFGYEDERAKSVLELCKRQSAVSSRKQG